MQRLRTKAAALPPPYRALAASAALALLAAGCGGAIPSSDGGPASIELASSSLGHHLTDGEGHTLYVFERDEQGESYCNGACASVWPPLETSSTPRSTGAIPTSALGTIKRNDGDLQVTYRGRPLYYYAADASSPGKTKGEDVNQFGASWYAVGPNGKPLEPSEDTGDSGNSGGSQGNGGGY
jgi:predicted lipoprotein with Yx(FWY)xxD motif